MAPPMTRWGDTAGLAVPAGVAEDSPATELETLLPASEREAVRGRWFDLCFRLIILALAALWLLTPPPGGALNRANEKAAATTR